MLSKINARVGAEVAHLSFRRSAPAKTWPYEEIWRALGDVLWAFIEHANADRIGPAALGLEPLHLGACLRLELSPAGHRDRK